ncbi:flagellar basal body rod protein FlgC [Desulfobulbus oligotrophicus]|jgi:flagellar basal-body rod protein FlgC|uniref:Flagellar basal-body rod protein FlgC n=1 Tax=Desulfobulbus oligotrophicus TaxID=1909699 RepID=A0A7T6AQR9_9BACT|nr:flagellar basal body rod protein FlgC [Desulfobulbus oligotrophicus]MDY0389315.1 flagellar basal body rod protein FlgC [Desulfobulbus oligotrophicus]QQG66036.1 flagellar basal body rod protein FlgC [Desulfobulbus oligotrophicus]
MDIFTTFNIAASGLKAQTTRLNTISANLANAETTSTPEGGPYRKKSVVFQTEPLSFKQHLHASVTGQTGIQGVKVAQIVEDTSPPQRIYDPAHPDAQEDGYVELPNISVLKETVDMMSATRSYEANTTIIKSAKRMALKALEIGR